MKKLFFLLLFYQLSFAQGEANLWYFGFNAGVDFNSGTPEAITNGNLSTSEGCASISDENGNLQFYTDGITVWTKNHTVMANGEGLLGHESTTQSTIIVQNSTNLKVYYIFTLDYEAESNGLRYSVVDMNAIAGLGVVLVDRNRILLSQATEKVSAVKHANGVDTWVVAHGWDNSNFYAYLITASGVNNTPVISSSGPISEGVGGNAAGVITFSPNGEKLAMCSNRSETHIFDFDAETGMVSNVRHVNSKPNVYGASFSPSGNLLYVSNLSNKIYQYNINEADISATEIALNNSLPTQFGQMQLGPDKRLYISRSGNDHLGIIENPDVIGNSCGLLVEGLYLEGKSSGTGMPAFVQSNFFDLITHEHYCFGDQTTFHFNSSVDEIVWDFDDPTTGTNNSSNAIETSHVFSAAGLYNIQATVMNGPVTSTFSLEIEIYELPVVNEITISQCDDDIDGYSLFNLKNSYSTLSVNFYNETISFYKTYSDAYDNLNPIENVENYPNAIANYEQIWVRVENRFGCYVIKPVELVVTTSQIPVDFYRIFYECDDNTDGIAEFDFSSVIDDIRALFSPDQEISIEFYANASNAILQIDPITNPNNYENIDYPIVQEIFIRVENVLDNTCLGIGSYILLNVLQQPQFSLDDSAIICMNQGASISISPNNPDDNYFYNWTDSNGNTLSTEETLEVSHGGFYTAIASFDYGGGFICESLPKTIQVIESEIATIIPESLNINDGNSSNSISINESLLGLGDYEFSLDYEFGMYQDESLFQNVVPGEHTLFVRDKNNCGTTSLVLYIVGYPSFFTPNDDNKNDFWNVKGIQNSEFTLSSVNIYDRFGKLLFVINSDSAGWNGTYNNTTLPSSDYWFTLRLLHKNGIERSINGHFSLVR